MNPQLAFKLAIATAAVFLPLTAIGSYNHIRAYLDIPSSVVVVENWSAFLVPFSLTIAGFITSGIGFFGGFFGPFLRRYVCVFIFAVSSLCIHAAHWLAVALGVLRFHGALDVLPLLLGFAWFGWLTVALWPNYSLKRTAADRLR
jgi:hypothetical protein